MIWSISWKNVWRNKVRSIVVVLAVTTGLIGGIFGGAIMEGMVEQRFDAAVNIEIGHLQLHHPDFGSTMHDTLVMTDVAKIMAAVDTISTLKARAIRSKRMVVMSSTRQSAGLILYGIDPEAEKAFSRVHECIIPGTGSYFDDEKTNQILISEKTAKTLMLVNYTVNAATLHAMDSLGVAPEAVQQLAAADTTTIFRTDQKFLSYLRSVFGREEAEKYRYKVFEAAKLYKLRAKITTSLRDTARRNVSTAFRIAGIYKTNNLMFDEMTAFALDSDLHSITGMDENAAHEIAIMLTDIEYSHNTKKQLSAALATSNVRVEDWLDLSPELKMLEAYMGTMNYVLIVIILLALGFGIVNTMLMVVLERTKELGMLMAIGMNKARVFGMVILESVFLSLTGGVVGMILSSGLIAYYGQTGISLGGDNAEVLESVGYASVMYPTIGASFYFGVTVLVVLTGILASVYPARKAIKLNPVEAIRQE